MLAPTILTKTDSSIKINWKKSVDDKATYEVFQATETGDFEVNGKPTSALERTISGLTKGETYRFKVRQINLCGTEESELSPELIVALTSNPAQMPKIITEQIDCSVKLSWTKPDNGGTPIEEYKIEVKDY